MTRGKVRCPIGVGHDNEKVGHDNETVGHDGRGFSMTKKQASDRYLL